MTQPDHDAPNRPGRATVFVGDLTIERILDLPDGVRVVGISHDFARLGVLLAMESDSLPLRYEGEIAMSLGRLVVETMTDEAGATWFRPLLDPM